ncbi:uncharacterized protein LOC107263229 [Cephus cinctus]|uniref:Uncharacterized protein LOC107263229 n=1 Tax=Cephus cinctus TaxID=211228 RepID=A0AAJ7BHT1_CEPCN|nr:uncharacterized protein LOC107263229 [Cephus cinctus]
MIFEKNIKHQLASFGKANSFNQTTMAFKCAVVILSAISVIQAQNGYPRDNPARQLDYSQGYANNLLRDNEEMSGGEIPGEPGKDYPTFYEVPETRFDCQQQQYPGYYADTEAQCQAFHICQNGGRKDSFLCPNGTLFNQERLVCEWWNQVDCSQAQSFYSINEIIVKAMEEAERQAAERRASGYRYDSAGNPNGHRGVGSTARPQNEFDIISVETPAIRNPVASKFSQHGSPRPVNPFNSDRPVPKKITARPLNPVYGVPEVPQGTQGPAFNKQSGIALPDNSQITAANFRNQPSGHQEIEEINREYLPA